MHETPAQSDPVIVILEDRAHWRLGHFSKNFAELADGFVELGCRTEVLTSLGWAGDMKGHGFGLHRYSGVGRLTTRLLPALKGLTTAINHSPLRRMGPFLFRVQLMLTTWTSVRETRRLLRREHLVPTGIIVLSIAFSLRTLEHLARDERWIVYPLSTYVPSRREVARSTKNITVARASTQPTPLADIYPILTVNFSVGRQVRHRAGLLRDRLGIDPSTTMLLMVGAGHIWQDPATVIDAVRTRDDLQLVVVGGMADELDRYDLFRSTNSIRSTTRPMSSRFQSARDSPTTRACSLTLRRTAFPLSLPVLPRRRRSSPTMAQERCSLQGLPRRSSRHSTASTSTTPPGASLLSPTTTRLATWLPRTSMP
jgi:hypothetical protein